MHDSVNLPLGWPNFFNVTAGITRNTGGIGRCIRWCIPWTTRSGKWGAESITWIRFSTWGASRTTCVVLKEDTRIKPPAHRRRIACVQVGQYPVSLKEKWQCTEETYSEHRYRWLWLFGAFSGLTAARIPLWCKKWYIVIWTWTCLEERSDN